MLLAPWLRRSTPALLVSVALVGASLLARYVAYLVQVREPESEPLLALRLFDVNSERNVPTAWSVGLLLAVALLALQQARQPGPLRRGWAGLALLAVGLAADEGLDLHEQLGGVGRAVAGRALHFAWVVPGALAGAVLAGLALAALRRHDPVLRSRLVLAGVVYVLGALAVESVSGLVLRADGDREAYVAVTAVEEGLEMAGLCLLLGAVLLARRPRPPGLRAVVPVQRVVVEEPVALPAPHAGRRGRRRP